MSDDEDEYKRTVEREARMGRRFSLADAVGREGGGFFRGASPVPRLQQVQVELSRFVSDYVRDASGALRAVLIRHIMTHDTIVAEHFGEPLAALEVILDRFLDNDARYYELVREVDAEWGRLMLERPYFQEPGEPAEEEDEYTHDSVRAELLSLRDLVRGQRE
jgi:hypothetical protein